MKEKILIFDMDGTIADFYGVENWHKYLREENAMPYIMADPIPELNEIIAILYQLKDKGYKVVITSWLAKDSTKEFKEQVRAAKKFWLEYYGFPYDKIYLVQYGTPKAYCTNQFKGTQILFDDNKEVRERFQSYKSQEKNIAVSNEEMLGFLKKLLDK